MKTIRSEWLILWNAIKALLGDKPLMSAVAGLVAAYLVSRDPTLSAQNVQNGILVLAGLVVGTYKLEDIIQAVASVYSSKASAALAVVTDNTEALKSNTSVTQALNDTTKGVVGPALLAAVSPRTTDVHTPQTTDPSRA